MRFYEDYNQEQWTVPSNPHINPISPRGLHRQADYNHLSETFQTTDIIQLLVDNADESDKEIYLDDDKTVLLIIN